MDVLGQVAIQGDDLAPIFDDKESFARFGLRAHGCANHTNAHLAADVVRIIRMVFGFEPLRFLPDNAYLQFDHLAPRKRYAPKLRPQYIFQPVQ